MSTETQSQGRIEAKEKSPEGKSKGKRNQKKKARMLRKPMRAAGAKRDVKIHPQRVPIDDPAWSSPRP